MIQCNMPTWEDLDTIRVPSGENATDKTKSEWPSIIRTHGLQVSSIQLFELPKDNLLCLYKFQRVVRLGVKCNAE